MTDVAAEPETLTDEAILARFQRTKNQPTGSQTLGFRLVAVSQADKSVEVEFEAKAELLLDVAGKCHFRADQHNRCIRPGCHQQIGAHGVENHLGRNDRDEISQRSHILGRHLGIDGLDQGRIRHAVRVCVRWLGKNDNANLPRLRAGYRHVAHFLTGRKRMKNVGERRPCRRKPLKGKLSAGA